MKKRMIYLLRLLYEKTDEQHMLSTYEILDYLASVGCSINRKTLKSDIDLFVELGMDIVTITSSPNKYFWGTRTFQIPELKLLIDAVSSSGFITAKKSDELIKKLGIFASRYQTENMTRHLVAAGRVMPGNENVYYIVDVINDAINDGKKITFKYLEYTGDKKQVFRNKGELYTISPYVLYWNDDFYYVVGYSDKRKKVISFRVDRLYQPKITDIDAIPRPADFDVTNYSREIFEMYDGETTEAQLNCDDELMKYVVDRFGEDVKTDSHENNTFTATVEVALSPTFYGWVFQFAGRMRIVEPQKALGEFKKMLVDVGDGMK